MENQIEPDELVDVRLQQLLEAQKLLLKDLGKTKKVSCYTKNEIEKMKTFVQNWGNPESAPPCLRFQFYTTLTLLDKSKIEQTITKDPRSLDAQKLIVISKMIQPAEKLFQHSSSNSIDSTG